MRAIMKVEVVSPPRDGSTWLKGDPTLPDTVETTAGLIYSLNLR